MLLGFAASKRSELDKESREAERVRERDDRLATRDAVGELQISLQDLVSATSMNAIKGPFVTSGWIKVDPATEREDLWNLRWHDAANRVTIFQSRIDDKELLRLLTNLRAKVQAMIDYEASTNVDEGAVFIGEYRRLNSELLSSAREAHDYAGKLYRKLSVTPPPQLPSPWSRRWI